MYYSQFKKKFDFSYLENFLREEGIIFKYDWTCCNTCGHAEILEEIQNEKDDNKIIGYLFYHDQEAYSIKHQLKDKNDMIEIYFAWSTLDNYCTKSFLDKIDNIIKKLNNIQFIRPENENTKIILKFKII